MNDDLKQELARKIGRRLRRARESRKLDGRELARRSGILEKRLRQCEAGVCRVTVAELETLADALAIPVLYFFEGCPVCGND